MNPVRALVVAGMLVMCGQVCAQEDFGCGLIDMDVEGGCFIFRVAGYEGFWVLDDYGGFMPGDSVHVIGQRATIGDNCPWCGFFQYPCLLDVQISYCRPRGTCCEGRVGDADGSGGAWPTIGDVSAMIDAKFVTGTCISEGPGANIRCFAEADVNQSGGCDPTCDDITIGDITGIIDCLFVSGFGECIWPDCPICP